ncbi:MAG: hypothetical protein P4L82_06545 [Ancalomicrobiaceae bacterium]|nr:hypothetical protein [Ancalomicrobiaceae bacterium]
MKETDRLTTMLFPEGNSQELLNLKFFAGRGVASTTEFRNEVHKAIHFVRSGMCESRSHFGDALLPQVEIDEFLAVA